MKTTEQRLDDLYEARGFLEDLRRRKREALDALLTPEIRSRMLTIEAEYEEPLAIHAATIADMEGAVKFQVEQEGASAKGQHLHAVWMKGRVSWDSKALDAFSKAEPRILAFRKEGSPSVTIRAISK